MERATDEEQLEFAAREGRVLVTANKGDYTRLHWEWVAAERAHAGIVIVPQLMDLKLRMRKFRELLSTTSPEELAGKLIYLSSWTPPESFRA